MLYDHTQLMASKRQKQTALVTAGHTIVDKLTAMANSPASDRSSNDDGITRTQLVEELSKQRASLKEDISTLIQESLGPLHTSVNALKETVDGFQQRLTATESLAGENFDKIFETEAAIKTLRTQNATLMDRVEDLENRSRRANLRIVNVPEDSEGAEDTVKFVSGMLMEVTGNALFESAPALERAHRIGKKPEKSGVPPRPFVVCFHRFQEKERMLQWARQHTATYRNATLRIYPDYSVNLSRRRAEFNDVKQALYQKGIKFQLLYPAVLRVTHDGNTFKFNTPEEAKAFYDQRVMGD